MNKCVIISQQQMMQRFAISINNALVIFIKIIKIGA
jgi:hypothetical protein